MVSNFMSRVILVCPPDKRCFPKLLYGIGDHNFCRVTNCTIIDSHNARKSGTYSWMDMELERIPGPRCWGYQEPWCFTNGMKWEKCDVPYCQDMMEDKIDASEEKASQEKDYDYGDNDEEGEIGETKEEHSSERTDKYESNLPSSTEISKSLMKSEVIRLLQNIVGIIERIVL